ncbi:MAG: hypothetical protein GXZ07_05265 [Firmicutes bacterium]|nr:hypothetical protein [Bacillota bacterium]
MKQFVVTPAIGKRLIGKALAVHPEIQRALSHGTVVIVAGTTNGYIVEEIFAAMGREDMENFPRRRFFRGITLPPSYTTAPSGRLPDESKFPGDVVITRGVWQKGKTIFDVVDNLEEGDVILKGANALDLTHKRAAILIAHPRGGTITAALQAVIGRRVRLIIPVGLEKCISGNLDELAAKLNAPGASGLRLFPVPGQVFTEIDALALLTGAAAELFAAGGVCGAEGGVWLAVSGEPSQEEAAGKLLESLSHEPPFSFEEEE